MGVSIAGLEGVITKTRGACWAMARYVIDAVLGKVEGPLFHPMFKEIGGPFLVRSVGSHDGDCSAFQR